MLSKWIKAFILVSFLTFTLPSSLATIIEISGSPFSTGGAPMARHIKNGHEKMIVVDPHHHVYGAYNARGQLIRWGIATAGSDFCPDSTGSCRTKTGQYRIYLLGNADCVSKKYDNAPMPYCMYFSGGQALHGSNDIQFDNISHGCVRVHVEDAKWLRYHFVESPNKNNLFRGTKIIIYSYD